MLNVTDTLKLAYVVPTKDHPDDLEKFLDSLTRQTRMPDQVIIVDGSDPAVKNICDAFADLPLTYVREFPPSLARQRNAGMAALTDDITVAGYMDDDLVLEPETTERMAAFWVGAGDDVGGASFSIINQPVARDSFLLRFFRMSGNPPGRVLPSGFPCQIPYVTQTIETEWLYGGATMWRRGVIDEFSYDEWYIGYGFLEDLDYSYRVSRKHRLFVVGDAQLWHFSHPMPLTRQFEFGRQQVFNRLYFAGKHKNLSAPWVAWGMFGQVTLNLLALVRHPDGPRLDRLRGNIQGLLAALGGRKSSFDGHWKQ
ncbi:MAG: glycosyltransferase [Alphaproteobacteria bacterium]|nr:glycosyltransferase [Alphaproteobacteria bacterium]